jgi:ribose 5-phosphate isomerase A
MTPLAYMLQCMNPKQRAADAAIAFIESGMVVGLGTGSTADYFLQSLSSAIKFGTLRGIRGIPTSRQSERRALHLGIPLLNLGEGPNPDVCVDGADEIAPNLDLTKGLGGALVREKIVAQNSKRLIIIADSSKLVDRLGTRAPLPVEAAQFGHQSQEAFLRDLGAVPTLRRGTDGVVFVTDNGNVIYDCKFPDGIADPIGLEILLGRRAGIVDWGLFLGMAEVALIADGDRVERRIRNT